LRRALADNRHGQLRSKEYNRRDGTQAETIHKSSLL
jgi:hypothetical protein